MIEIKLLEIAGFRSAIKGMRNPKNSWEKSDSLFSSIETAIGENDMTLATQLIKGGREHRKYLRMIQVWLDIKAPRYYFTEFDTYKIGTTRNSCSTMHKLFEEGKEFTKEDFAYTNEAVEFSITKLNEMQKQYFEYKANKDTKNKNRILREAKAILPEGYLTLSTINLNYEVLRNMYHQRKRHRLTEWKDFCKWVENNLPYAKELICDEY